MEKGLPSRSISLGAPYNLPVPFFFLAGKRVRFDGNRLVFRESGRDIALFEFREGEQAGYSYPFNYVDAYSTYGAMGLSGSRGIPIWVIEEVRDKLSELVPPYTIIAYDYRALPHERYFVVVEEVDSPVVSPFMVGIDTTTRFRFPGRNMILPGGWFEGGLQADFGQGLGLSSCWGIVGYLTCPLTYVYQEDIGVEIPDQAVAGMCTSDTIDGWQVGLFLESAVINGVQFGEGSIPTAIQDRFWGEVKRTFTSVGEE